ncbi:MAG: hypothetical protein CMF25_06700 [Kangiellaceae bacterium]|nr:hypothetical protein [Kangiellaceae bacterium]|tara:strand:+ start:1241 stop:1639 length:399 start_codon:yes stop_codon:yes gene_type:complete
MNLVEKFNDSYERIMYGNTAFFDHFYQQFVQHSEEIAAMFKHIDMTHQKVMLKKSLVVMIVFAATRQRDDDLRRIAIKHQHLGLKSHHYDLWLDTLVEAARTCDPHFDEDCEKGWRHVIGAGIDYMKAVTMD